MLERHRQPEPSAASHLPSHRSPLVLGILARPLLLLFTAIEAHALGEFASAAITV